MSGMFFQIYTTASQPHSTAMDRNRAARSERGSTLTFASKTQEIEKSSEYGVQSTKIEIPPTAAGWFYVVVQAGTESTERRIFHQDKSSGPRGPNAISKALGR